MRNNKNYKNNKIKNSVILAVTEFFIIIKIYFIFVDKVTLRRYNITKVTL